MKTRCSYKRLKVLGAVIIMVLTIVLVAKTNEIVKANDMGDQKYISECDFYLDTDTYSYTGEEIKPNLLIDDGVMLKKGKDYIVEYDNNISPGVGRIIVYGEGVYIGTKVVEFNIVKNEDSQELEKIDINTCDFYLDTDTYSYTGEEIKPNVMIDGGSILKKGEDYAIEYCSNICPGEGKIIIYGMGKYTGEKVVKFNIIKRESGEEEEKVVATKKPIKRLPNAIDINTCDFYLDTDTYSYTGKEIKPDLLIDGESKLNEYKDYIVEYVDNINPGVGYMNIKGIGKYTGERKIEFEIVAKSDIQKKRIEACRIEIVKNGSMKTLDEIANSIVVKDLNGNVLEYNKDYNLGKESYQSYERGRMQLILIIEGIGEYTGKIKTIKFDTK